MNTYYLCKLASGAIPGRVVISATPIADSEILRIIDADHWGKAREYVGEFEFDHKEGYGYF